MGGIYLWCQWRHTRSGAFFCYHDPFWKTNEDVVRFFLENI